MATSLTLFQTVLRKLWPSEVDQNFINLRAVADAVADLLGGFRASQTPGAGQIPVVKADGSFALPGRLVGGFGATGAAGVQDWNDATNCVAGWGPSLLLANATNGPTASAYYYHVMSVEYITKTGAGNLTQYAIPYMADDRAGTYYRFRYQGAWSVWYKQMYTLADGTLYAGIKFPATQVASADPNTLDDYEEGTFTPTAVGGTSAGVGTYGSFRNGSYTRIGNRVFFDIQISWTAHTGTGALTIAGLPFTAKASYYIAASVYGDALTIGAGKQLMARISGGGSSVALWIFDGGGAATAAVAVETDTLVNFLAIQGTYSV